MAHNTGNALQSLLDGATMYLARVYRITRQDGTVLRLTDHDSKIVVREGYLDGSSDPFSADAANRSTDCPAGASLTRATCGPPPAITSVTDGSPSVIVPVLSRTTVVNS